VVEQELGPDDDDAAVSVRGGLVVLARALVESAMGAREKTFGRGGVGVDGGVKIWTEMGRDERLRDWRLVY
jgi:hypothetical protein